MLSKWTPHPIVEGATRVLRAIATPTEEPLTVSTLDPADPDKLFYSVPCLLGQQGLVERKTDCLQSPAIASSLRTSLETLREVLARHPD